jgi:hypothetical protein
MADVYVTINAPLGPMDRGERFEDPLYDLLEGKVRGFEVTGGGTSVSKTGVSNCDIDMAFEESADDVLPAIIAALEKLGAPKGSVARVGGKDKTVKFGATEGLAVHLPGLDEAAGIQALLSRCEAAVGGAGEFWTGWTNAEEAVLCFYGPTAERMRELLTPVLDGEALDGGWRFEPLT